MKMIKNMVLVISHGVMVGNTLENGERENNMEKEHLIKHQERVEKENGQKEGGFVGQMKDLNKKLDLIFFLVININLWKLNSKKFNTKEL